MWDYTLLYDKWSLFIFRVIERAEPATDLHKKTRRRILFFIVGLMARMNVLLALLEYDSHSVGCWVLCPKNI